MGRQWGWHASAWVLVGTRGWLPPLAVAPVPQATPSSILYNPCCRIPFTKNLGKPAPATPWAIPCHQPPAKAPGPSLRSWTLHFPLGRWKGCAPVETPLSKTQHPCPRAPPVSPFLLGATEAEAELGRTGGSGLPLLPREAPRRNGTQRDRVCGHLWARNASFLSCDGGASPGLVRDSRSNRIPNRYPLQRFTQG